MRSRPTATTCAGRRGTASTSEHLTLRWENEAWTACGEVGRERVQYVLRLGADVAGAPVPAVPRPRRAGPVAGHRRPQPLGRDERRPPARARRLRRHRAGVLAVPGDAADPPAAAGGRRRRRDAGRHGRRRDARRRRRSTRRYERLADRRWRQTDTSRRERGDRVRRRRVRPGRRPARPLPRRLAELDRPLSRCGPAGRRGRPAAPCRSSGRAGRARWPRSGSRAACRCRSGRRR